MYLQAGTCILNDPGSCMYIDPWRVYVSSSLNIWWQILMNMTEGGVLIWARFNLLEFWRLNSNSNPPSSVVFNTSKCFQGLLKAECPQSSQIWWKQVLLEQSGKFDFSAGLASFQYSLQNIGSLLFFHKTGCMMHQLFVLEPSLSPLFSCVFCALMSILWKLVSFRKLHITEQLMNTLV